MRLIVCLTILMAATLRPGFSRQGDDAARARTVLLEGLRDNNPDVRKEATLAAGLIRNDEKAAAMVIPLLSDPDVPVRLAAISTLADLGRAAAVPELERALDDPVPEVAFAAAKALYTFRQSAGREALLAVLEGETSAKSNPIRARFREMVRMFHTPKSAAVLAVKEGLGFVPIPGLGEGAGALESLLFANDVSPRASAALLLARDKRPETRRALLNALDDSDWSVRAAAAQALALRNDLRLRTALVPRFADDDRRVRYRAAAAYLRLVNPAGRRLPARRHR